MRSSSKEHWNSSKNWKASSSIIIPPRTTSHGSVLIAFTWATSTSTAPLIGAKSARNGPPPILSTNAPRTSEPLFAAPLEIIPRLPSTPRLPLPMDLTLSFHEEKIIEGVTRAGNPLPSLRLSLKTRVKERCSEFSWKISMHLVTQPATTLNQWTGNTI